MSDKIHTSSPPCEVYTGPWASLVSVAVPSLPRGVGAASCPWLVAGLVSVAPVSPISKQTQVVWTC